MISEVGYLHEHPDIERLLLRKGIHLINEAELHQIIEMAIAWKSQETTSIHQGDGHLLTGPELVELDAWRKPGFEGHGHIIDDLRASLLAGFQLPPAKQAGSQYFNAGPKHSMNPWTGRQRGTWEASLRDGQLRRDTRLGEFGMDSMLAAEFRGHIFHLAHVDVPFMMILGANTTIQDLTDLIADALVEKRAASEDWGRNQRVRFLTRFKESKELARKD